VAAIGGTLLWRVNQSLREGETSIARSKEFRFTLAAVPSHANSKFQFFSQPADNRSAVLYRGDVYVCGRSSLRRYRTDGRLLNTWQVGRELPAAPLVQLAARR
jgi:hypothetical protein